jgi:hypothetical protein
MCNPQRGFGCGGIFVTYQPYEDWLLRMTLAQLRAQARRQQHLYGLSRLRDRHHALLAQLDDIDSRWDRVKLAYEEGIYDVRDLASRRADLSATRRETAHEAAVVAPVLEDGLTATLGVSVNNWADTPFEAKRDFFQTSVRGVRVGLWPKHLPRTVNRFASARAAARRGELPETEEDFQERRRHHHDRALALRCQISWAPEPTI